MTTDDDGATVRRFDLRFKLPDTTPPDASMWDMLASIELYDAGAGVLAPVDVKSGVCDECELAVTESYCSDCGMWVCDACWPAHESGDVDFDDEDDYDEDDYDEDDYDEE